MIASAVLNVRRALRRVSSIGHSHARSICACPVTAMDPLAGYRRLRSGSASSNSRLARSTEARSAAVKPPGWLRRSGGSCQTSCICRLLLIRETYSSVALGQCSIPVACSMVAISSGTTSSLPSATA